MSKLEAQRAMREARYQKAASRGTKRMVTSAGDRAVSRAAEVRLPATEEAPGPAMCGHRAISGRTCTREHGHTSKSHRYS
jgi:hypothetical protein